MIFSVSEEGTCASRALTRVIASSSAGGSANLTVLALACCPLPTQRCAAAAHTSGHVGHGARAPRDSEG